MSAISYPTSPARDAYELTPWTDASGNQWLFSPAKLRWSPYVTSGGGGGVSTFAALTDKASVNLPVVNTPLATALGLKAPLDSPSFTAPALGAATATSINKVAITQPATGSTLTIADGVTVNAGGSITVASGFILVNGCYVNANASIFTDVGGSFSTSTGTVSFSNTTGNPISLTAPIGGSTATLPAGISTLARTDSAQTFSGLQAMSGTLSVTGALTGTTASFSNTVAGTATTPAINIASTWTTTGLPTALKVNVVSDTGPSNASSLLMDLQFGGITKFSAMKDGSLQLDGVTVFKRVSNQLHLYAGGNQKVRIDDGALGMVSGYAISWSDSSSFPSGGKDLSLFRDGVGILAQRVGTSAQTSRIYDTYTSSTDYHRLAIATTRATPLMAGPSVTLTGLIPAGAVVMGVTTKVTTAITGATGYSVGTAASPTRFGSNLSPLIGVTSDNRNWTSGTIECFPTATDIVLTAVGQNFTAGVVYVSVQYMTGQAD